LLSVFCYPNGSDTLLDQNAVGVVKSVKASSDDYSPVRGEILDVNEAPTASPNSSTKTPRAAAWIYKIKLAEPCELDTPLDRLAYLAYVREQG
jgi:glycine cleavage system H protein